eukprot:2825929-Rhodomonas_salina.1
MGDFLNNVVMDMSCASTQATALPLLSPASALTPPATVDQNEHTTLTNKAIGNSFIPLWFSGTKSMESMLQDARNKGHAKFAAMDVNQSSGSKAWASFPTFHEFFEYIQNLPVKQRCLYELITVNTPVCLWFDIEFRSTEAADGETRRNYLEVLLKEAIKASFSIEHPLMFWGKSSRFETQKQSWKHSYQLRVPSIVFECQHKDSSLSKWVAQFVQLTSNDPTLHCPVSAKHLIDTVVYSRSRCVRTCYCMKKNDSTCTPLQFVPELGDGDRITHGEKSQFTALLVEPCVSYEGFGTIHITADAQVTCKIPSLGKTHTDQPFVSTFTVEAVNTSGRCDPMDVRVHKQRKLSCYDDKMNPKQKRQRKCAGTTDPGMCRPKGWMIATGSSNDVLNVPQLDISETAYGNASDTTADVIECLALMGPEFGEDYENWSNVMFAVRNKSNGTAALQAFIEWSKRAKAFKHDSDVETAFLSTQARSSGGTDNRPCRGLSTLRKCLKANPFIVYKQERAQGGEVANGTINERIEWHAFMRNVDTAKTSWRVLVRLGRLIWQNKKDEVIQDLYAHMDEFADRAESHRELEKVWDLPACQCKHFIDCIVNNIKRELLWPKLITKVLPELLGNALARPVEIINFSCDQISSLDVMVLGTADNAGTRQNPTKYTVNLANGIVNGTKICLKATAFMFDDRDPMHLKSTYVLDAQVNWAKQLVAIPSIAKNMRCVTDGPWCIYQEEKGVWDEIKPQSPLLRVFLSDQVKAYFEPLAAYLDFKSGFDAVADTQRQILEKILGKFSNTDFLDKMLDALEGNSEVTVPDFNKVFNCNPHVLPCENGLLDFRTLCIRPLEREDFFTYKVPAAWDPNADATAPQAFLRSLFPYDTDEMVEFIQSWLGYCMTGLTLMQILVFMIGYGSNGKSKLSQVMENILGPAGFAHVTYEALCQRTTGPNEEIYDARNARMWQVDENDGEAGLNMAMIKRITGEDTIKCRQLYGHTVKVPPRAKLNFAVNKPPKLPACATTKEQSSLSRRFVYVDCPMQFVDLTPGSKDEKKIASLKEEFSSDQFKKCVAQVDINMDQKLENMTP